MPFPTTKGRPSVFRVRVRQAWKAKRWAWPTGRTAKAGCSVWLCCYAILALILPQGASSMVEYQAYEKVNRQMLPKEGEK